MVVVAEVATKCHASYRAAEPDLGLLGSESAQELVLIQGEPLGPVECHMG